MEKDLKWAVLGTGVIANQMAEGLQNMGKSLYAVGNRTYEKAVAFAEKYQVKKVYKDFYEMFTDPLIDVIYITTPHNTHIDFLRLALSNGKHVLCEKSITLNKKELEEAKKLAKENQVILGEAMTIWHMPLYKKLWELVQSNKLGKVQMIQTNFGSFKEYNMKNRFFNPNLAGGAMLDIGVYALSITRSFMEQCPTQILSQYKPAPTGVDEQVGILLMNDARQMATISLSLHSKQPKRIVISCEKAYIEIMEYPRAQRAVIVDAETGEETVVEEGETINALQYEMEDMETAIKTKNDEIMKLDLTSDVMDMMTSMRNDWNVVYPEEMEG